MKKINLNVLDPLLTLVSSLTQWKGSNNTAFTLQSCQIQSKMDKG